MSHFLVIVSVVLLNWWSFRTVSRRLAKKRHGLATPAGEQARHPNAMPSVPSAVEPIATDGVIIGAEPIARAFPIQGFPQGLGSAGVLEGLLRHMAGVTRAYVSPVTALAYVDYLPAQVTEEQLVGVIRGGGYLVGDEAHRFDWRHTHPA
jgi:hypothetical protein